MGLARKDLPPTIAVKEPGEGSVSAGWDSLYALMRFSISGLKAVAHSDTKKSQEYHSSSILKEKKKGTPQPEQPTSKRTRTPNSERKRIPNEATNVALPEMADKTLDWPGGGVTKGADGVAFNLASELRRG